MTGGEPIQTREASAGSVAIDRTVAAYHVHALAPGIDKQIVGVTTDIAPAQSLSRCRVERLHARGTSEDCKYPVVCQVGGKRVVGLQFCCRPAPDRSVGVTGQDLNRSGIRSVHEDSRAVGFELKTLGMSLEWNI